MSNARDTFAIFGIAPGESGLDYDVDCTPWLTGTALMASFELEQEVGDPVAYQALAAVIFDGGRSAKFVAACPDGTPPKDTFVRVRLTDTAGRVGRQWFQMTVR